jgi:predicted dinucleotide-binding enzyme
MRDAEVVRSTPRSASPTARASSPAGVAFLSGNDAPANATVAALIERLGFAALDLGELDNAAPPRR